MTQAKHPSHVVGWDGTLDELAVAIGNMRYDVVAQFIQRLSEEIDRQAVGDWQNNRKRLSARLTQTTHDLSAVKHDFMAAWHICAPFMMDDAA